MELISILMIVIAIFVGTILFQRYQKWQELADKINKIPGLKAYPFIGTAHIFFGVPREKIFQLLVNTWKKYPNIQRGWVGNSPEVRIAKAEYVEKIISSTKHIEKGYVYDFIKPWLGDGLLISKGDRWHSHRKIITPTFHFSILDGFCDVFAEQSEILVQKLSKHAGTGKAVDICPYVTRCALDIICETAMGTKINAQDSSNNEYVAAIYEISELAINRLFRPWVHKDFIYNLTKNGRKFKKNLEILHGFTSRVITERTKVHKTLKSSLAAQENEDDIGKKKRRAFLDLLLDAIEDGKNLTMEDLRQEVDTFMFEGHDTTTSAIDWALFCVGNNPDVQEKIAEEMELIFGDSDRPATIKDLSEMKYLERVLKETMRIYPPVPIIGRISSEDVEVGGYLIPKNTFISIVIIMVMRDPAHFPNPAKFDPDRFLPEVANKRHPYAYIPFSAGPRNCIGQKFALLEEKAVVSSVLRNYKVASAQKPEEIELLPELILRSNKGINLSFEKRRK